MPNEAAQQALRIYKRGCLFGVALVPVLLTLVFNALWPGSGLLWWLGFLVANVICYKVYSWIVFFLALFIVARRDALEERQLKSTEIDAFTVVGLPKSVYGRYLDHEFYEWLDIMDANGKVIRATFYGTADLTREIILPPKAILLLPGLIYQVGAS